MRWTISYREDFGLWWPDYDSAPARTLQYVKKHIDDVDAAVKLCANRRTCVQAGSHAGLWPMRLANSFERVLSFEPDPGLFECARRNCSGVNRISVRPFALGSKRRVARMSPHHKAGSWSISDHGAIRVDMTTIDSEVKDADCDLIVLDIEGYEVPALRGAARTIERCRPVIHVEELGRSKQGIQQFMRSIGYVERVRVGHDAIYTWGEETC